jgi:hypothetical protein
LSGIAVRKTASLPLAYARQSIIFRELFHEPMDARVEPAHHAALSWRCGTDLPAVSSPLAKNISLFRLVETAIEQ